MKSIELKLTAGDAVYFLHNNAVMCKVIRNVIVTVYQKAVHIKYNVVIRQAATNLDRDEERELGEKEAFASKQELLESL